MKGEQLETTGDEQRDFEDMLAQFKKGIDENVGHDDYEAHYDLGIAFKEMGLLDEAIAEFQKALRDPGGRLRTSEALGVAFFEKGQMAVAEAVLRRAVDTLGGGDDQKIGLIYWLGRACEAQGRLSEARQSYERAMAVDIRSWTCATGRPPRRGAAAMSSQVASVSLATVQAPILHRLPQVQAELRRIVEADFNLIADVNAHLFQMQGKMFRPTLALLTDEATGGPDPRAVPLAATIELIHLATLVHDDSVDHSVLRRGMPTINSLFSHQVSVIMGDYLYSRAVIELVDLSDLDALRVLSRVTNEMTVGEMRQLLAHDRLQFTEEQYDLLIRAKTASLHLRRLRGRGAAVRRRRCARHWRASARRWAWRSRWSTTCSTTPKTERDRQAVGARSQGAQGHLATYPRARPPDPAARREVQALMATSEPADALIARVIGLVAEAGGLDYARARRRRRELLR